MPSLLLLAIGFLTVCLIIVAWMIVKAPEGHDSDEGFTMGAKKRNVRKAAKEKSDVV